MLAPGNIMSQQLFQTHKNEQPQTGYPDAFGGSYDGWPGMALKQIMGQIDLFNLHSNVYNNCGPEKWQISMESNNNHGTTNGYNAQVRILLIFAMYD
jgi:hypothetical protein